MMNLKHHCPKIMVVNLADKLVIAISSRALFDLDQAHQVFEQEGLAGYTAYQIGHEEVTLRPGVAFSLIQRLQQLRYPQAAESAVEVVLVSKNDPNTGLRVFNSIAEHKLDIRRAVFTNGRSPYPYFDAFKVDLFLSANAQDVRLALEKGYASATILSGVDFQDDPNPELRIAFDGDAVLFSDESERVYQEQGLAAFQSHEASHCDIPLAPGPFQPFLAALHRLQTAQGEFSLIRTALVTARSSPAHKRVIKTLRHWGIRIDEAFFLGGLDKAPVLRQFKPHIFFDDQTRYCATTRSVIPTGHVPSGITN